MSNILLKNQPQKGLFEHCYDPFSPEKVFSRSATILAARKKTFRVVLRFSQPKKSLFEQCYDSFSRGKVLSRSANASLNELPRISRHVERNHASLSFLHARDSLIALRVAG